MSGKRYRLLLCAAIVPIMAAFSCKASVAPQTQGPALLPKTETASVPGKWRSLSDGIERLDQRLIHDGHTYALSVLRIDSEKFEWAAHYSEEPKTLTTWQTELNAEILINGAFFTEEYKPTGYFRINKVVSGNKAYEGATIGTIAITDGRIELIETNNEMPSNPDIIFQSFPLLLRPGGAPHVTKESDKIARRTILAQDRDGRTIIIIFDTTPVTLFDAAQILARSNLGLDWALNLDGGPSTGLLVKGSSENVTILPAIELPIVLSASKKD